MTSRLASLKAVIGSIDPSVSCLPYFDVDSEVGQQDRVRSGSSLINHILENLDEDLSGMFSELDSLNVLDDMTGPDIDSWYPYYRQRSLVINALSSHDEGLCEEFLKDIYGKGEIFTGCEDFHDCEARMCYAALEIAWQEMLSKVREEVEGYFSGLSELPTVEIDGEEYPYLEVGPYQVGTDDLNDVITAAHDDTVIIDEVNAIDDRFAYFVPESTILLGEDEVRGYILEHIDAEAQFEEVTA
jgi:hypothetical protein